MDYNKNYYNDLGLDKNATEEEIKKQYRKLAHKYHPDKNAGNDNEFKKINEANSILSDSKLKQEYDQRSPHGKSYSPFQSFNSGFGSSFEFHFGGMDDIFSQFFGGKNPFGFKEEFQENLDVNVNVNLNLKQIYENEILNIKFKKEFKVHLHYFLFFVVHWRMPKNQKENYLLLVVETALIN